MSLLSSGTVALQKAKAQLPPELLACMFHSSSPQPAAAKKRLGVNTSPQAPSRTRLVKDLKPKNNGGKSGATGRLEVAPRAPFVRDSLPHTGARDMFKERETTYKPFRRRDSETDSRRPRSSYSSSPSYKSERGGPRRFNSERDDFRRRPPKDEDYRRIKEATVIDTRSPKPIDGSRRFSNEKDDFRRRPPKDEDHRGVKEATVTDTRSPKPRVESRRFNNEKDDFHWRARKDEDHRRFKEATVTDTRSPKPLVDALKLSTSGQIPQERPRKPKIENPLSEEFDLSSRAVPTSELPTEFTSPPLMQGLLDSVVDILGPHAKPSPIQALSLKHLFTSPASDSEISEDTKSRWRQFLLASETGSGKSMAYLLPMLQGLKRSELKSSDSTAPSSDPLKPQRATNPRALVLAPTHELSRQLSGFAKALLHNIKLRVLCVSRANLPSTSRRDLTASKMASDLDLGMSEGGEFEVQRGTRAARPVDVLVGTPTKVLEMVRGRGWDRDSKNEKDEELWDFDDKGHQVKRRPFRVGEPEMGLENVEWVVVDEADVLFDPDFQESTRMLLADIATARGHPVTFEPQLVLCAPSSSGPAPKIPDYPFNLFLTTATIPSSLASYLDTYHPHLTRLASPNLHKLPSTLKTEYESWTGGNKNKDIERRIKRIWWEDSVNAPKTSGNGTSTSASATSSKSKILIFCNKSTKVEELGKYLTEQGIMNIALTSTSDTRHRGNNHHLDGFLRVREHKDEKSEEEKTDSQQTPVGTTGSSGEPTAVVDTKKPSARAQEEPHPYVLITTSLLSRGLDFSPSIKNVLIVDSPRNMIDFLHRAGRSGRAGERGKVVVFGKGKGRGSDRDKDVRKRVGALAA